jgi:hypothetical protein
LYSRPPHAQRIKSSCDTDSVLGIEFSFLYCLVENVEMECLKGCHI